MTWLNNDGLLVKFGTEKAVPEVAGEYKTYGATRTVECVLDLTTLTASSAIIAGVDNARFPTGAQIESVEVVTEVAATGSGAVFNLGFIKNDRSTALDADGLIAALPLASVDAAGERTLLTVGASYAGALIGTSLTDVGPYLVADYDTAAFTAGKVRIRINFHVV